MCYPSFIVDLFANRLLLRGGSPLVGASAIGAPEAFVMLVVLVAFRTSLPKFATDTHMVMPCSMSITLKFLISSHPDPIDDAFI